MRKLGLLVTLMVASVFMLGAAPGVASAANCTSIGLNHNSVNAAGAVRFYTQVSGCTDVSAIMIVRDNNPWTNTGWYSLSCPCQDQNGGLNSVYPGQSSVTITGSNPTAVVAVLAWCWWSGNHGVNEYYLWKIKNATTGTWGPLHDYLWTGTPHNVLC